MKQLPTTGSSELLERLSPFVPDDLINSLLGAKSGPGRPRSFSAAQLFRVNLLALLTPGSFIQPAAGVASPRALMEVLCPAEQPIFGARCANAS